MPDKDEVPGSSPGRPTTHRRRSERCRKRAGRARCRLGPRWGRTPIPAGTPVAPPGPSARASGSATTTHRGRAPSPRTPATRHAATSRCRLLRAHRAATRDRRSPRRPGLPGRSAGKCDRRGPHPDPAARVRQPPPIGQRDLGSVARVPASATIARAVDGSAATGASTGSGGQGRPITSTWPQRHRLGGRRRTRPDRRGQTPDGWTADGWTADGWTADGWTLDGWTADDRPPDLWTTAPGDRTPDGWTAGSRTPETGSVDTACWTPATDAVACLLAGSTTVTTPDPSRPAGRSFGQAPSGRATTRAAQQQGRRGHPRCYRWVWPPPRPSAAGGTPPSSRRLGALLSSDDYGSSVERQAHGQVLWRALAWLYEWKSSNAVRSSEMRGAGRA
jgi:hypothetical protein